MIPSPWEFTLLALAAYRLTRLLGWDDFPPIARAREWLLKEGLEPRCPDCGAERADYERHGKEWLSIGRCPNCDSKSAANFVPYHDRELLGEMFGCPFCLGAWVCLAVYLAWWALPEPTLVLATIAALSGAVGLIAKNLDP